MAPQQILIVDEKKETRNQLRGLLDTLSLDLKIMAVPSGEEALLEMRNTRFDLLLTDFALPGMDGVNLLEKAKERNPALKVILIMASDKGDDQRSTWATTADFNLPKPFKTADFFAAVDSCLGGKTSIEKPVERPVQRGPEEKIKTVSEKLARLRQSLKARTSLLVDNTGAILACAGDLPDESFETPLMQPVVETFCAGMKVIRSLKAEIPFTFQFFSGINRDLVLAQVGEKNALLVVLDPVHIPHGLNDILVVIAEVVGDLQGTLMELGIDQPQDREPIDEEKDPLEDVDEAELEAETPRIEALFKEGEAKLLKSEALDDFWESITEQETTTSEVDQADRLTYRQATQLGLAPEERDEE